jgi:hypothetical protein
MGQREIRVEFKPQLRPIGVGPFDPIAPSRPARPRVASVTAEDDLGSFIKDEQAYQSSTEHVEVLEAHEIPKEG